MINRIFLEIYISIDKSYNFGKLSFFLNSSDDEFFFVPHGMPQYPCTRTYEYIRGGESTSAQFVRRRSFIITRITLGVGMNRQLALLRAERTIYSSSYTHMCLVAMASEQL